MWKDIKGFEGIYEISDDREVRTKPKTITQISRYGKEYQRSFKSKTLKQWIDKEGYLTVDLGIKPYRIHWLYYNTFIGDSTGYYIDHIDRNRLNNDPSNLRLLNYSDSIKNRTLAYKPDIQDLTNKKQKLKYSAFPKGRPFQLRFSENGVRKTIGYYRTYEEAENKYRVLYEERQKRIDEQYIGN